jgi:hypothetical protein
LFVLHSVREFAAPFSSILLCFDVCCVDSRASYFFFEYPYNFCTERVFFCNDNPIQDLWILQDGLQLGASVIVEIGNQRLSEFGIGLREQLSQNRDGARLVRSAHELGLDGSDQHGHQFGQTARADNVGIVTAGRTTEIEPRVYKLKRSRSEEYLSTREHSRPKQLGPSVVSSTNGMSWKK